MSAVPGLYRVTLNVTFMSFFCQSLGGISELSDVVCFRMFCGLMLVGAF